MKKVFIVIVCILIASGCNYGKQNTKKGNNKYVQARLNSDGNVIINTSDITSLATFVNYEVDGVTIQLIVVRATDDTIRVALNTCGTCSPSPNAYFLQDGEYLVCQNCGNKFHIDDVGFIEGITKEGCNPIPVKIMDEKDDEIIISSSFIEEYKDNFKNWNGPLR